MKTFMDDVRFRRRDGGGMEIVLTKNLNAAKEKEERRAMKTSVREVRGVCDPGPQGQDHDRGGRRAAARDDQQASWRRQEEHPDQHAGRDDDRFLGHRRARRLLHVGDEQGRASSSSCTFRPRSATSSPSPSSSPSSTCTSRRRGGRELRIGPAGRLAAGRAFRLGSAGALRPASPDGSPGESLRPLRRIAAARARGELSPPLPDDFARSPVPRRLGRRPLAREASAAARGRSPPGSSPARPPRPRAAVAVAIELVHAASLVLDDLPSMDDARRRRGRPGPARRRTAWRPPSSRRWPCWREPSSSWRGAPGVGAGDARPGDRASSPRPSAPGLLRGPGGRPRGASRTRCVLEDLEAIHARKTGALFVAAVRGGALAGGAREARRSRR